MLSLVRLSILGLTLGIGWSEAQEGWLSALGGLLLIILFLTSAHQVSCDHGKDSKILKRVLRNGIWILMILHHLFDGVLLGVAVMSHEVLIALPALLHEMPKSYALLEHFRNQGFIPREAWSRVVGLFLWCVPGMALGWYYGVVVQRFATDLHPLGGGFAIGFAGLALCRRFSSAQGLRVWAHFLVVLLAALFGFQLIQYFHH